MPEQVNPLVGKTDNRKAGCGKSASPVWREGKPICLVFPTLSRLAFGECANITELDSNSLCFHLERACAI